MDTLVKQGVARDSQVNSRNFYYKLHVRDDDSYYFMLSRTHDAERWAKTSTYSRVEAMEIVEYALDHSEYLDAEELLDDEQCLIYDETYPKDGCIAPETVPSEFEYPKDDMSEQEFLSSIYIKDE